MALGWRTLSLPARQTPHLWDVQRLSSTLITLRGEFRLNTLTFLFPESSTEMVSVSTRSTEIGAASLDIQELLSDAGLGREMHSIVGQGQLDRVLKATLSTAELSLRRQQESSNTADAERRLSAKLRQCKSIL